MVLSKKTVCIIGAGESGLAALKECALQGLEPTCYDLDSDIGGMWHKKPPGQVSNTPAVWPTLVTNNSKYNMCYSDVPPDPRDPLFLSPAQLCAYFKRCIKQFDLEKYIQLNTRVVKVREAADHDETGRWEVYTCDSRQSAPPAGDAAPRGGGVPAGCRREIFDNVIVCSGWFKKPYTPDIPGLKSFKGSISHSFTYSNPRPFDGKKVLVVGNKFSAAEIASDISNLAAETYLALGQGTWIVHRMSAGGRAVDCNMPRSMIWSSDPEFAFNEFVLKEACGNMNHTTSGVGTAVQPASSPLCISDDLPVKIASGKIKPYGQVSEIKPDQVIFKEKETIHGLDAIVFCTGYRTDLSFVDFKIHNDDGKMEAYLMVFPIKRKHNTLALVGHYGTDGPMITLGENQARLAAGIMSGRHKLPSQKAMAQSVDFWNEISFTRRPSYQNYNIPGFSFMDTLAMEVGFYPSFWKIFLRDPVLAWRTWNGPYIAAQYRLLGPDSQWDKAREICYRAYEEDLSCVRNAEAKTVERPDLKRRRKQRALNALSLGAVIAGLVLWRTYKKGQLVWE